VIDRSHTIVLKRYAVLGVADVASKVMGFLATILVVRYFGDVGFGRVTFAFSVAMYATMLATFGTDVYAVKRGAAHPEGLPGLLSTVIALRAVIAMAVYALLIGVSLLSQPLRQELHLIALYGLSVFVGAFSLLWVPQASQRFTALACANFGTQALYLAIVVLGAMLANGLWCVPVAQVGGELLVAAGLLVWARLAGFRFGRIMPIREAWRLLVHSAPIGGSRFLRMFAIGSDVVILGYMVSMAQVGWYGGASKIFMLCVSLGSLYFVVLLPRLVERAQKNDDGLRRELVQSLKRVGLGGVVGMAALIFVAKPVLMFLFTEEFTAATGAFRLLAAAWFIGLVNGHFRNTLIAVGRQQTDLALVGISSTAHVALKIALIPVMGITGAAVGTVVGEMLLTVLSAWATWKALAQRRTAAEGRDDPTLLEAGPIAG